LGASFLEIENFETKKKPLFFVDLGNKNKTIVNDYTYPSPDADSVLIETTYGDRDHKPFEEIKQEFLQVIL
jgi:metallo-beta-lactamase family protein